MKIQIIQHTAADTAAAAGEVLEHLGHLVQTARIDRGDSVPDEVECDGLMMFGGSISFKSGDDVPEWVDREKELACRYIDAGKRVVGICLGSQLLASALGASISRNREPEVGWHPVQKLSIDAQGPVAAQFPDEMMVFNWHQYTFGIPEGAQRLFKSQACDNQAFVIGDRVFGLQFHLEANERTVRTFLAVSKLWKKQSPAIQSEEQILAGIESKLPQQNEYLKNFLMALFPPD